MSERPPGQQPPSANSPDWSAVTSLAENNTSESKPNFRSFDRFTHENTRNYIKDRFSENLKMLEELGDDHTAELYRTLMDEFPQLRIVKLCDHYEFDNASCTYDGYDKDEGFLLKIKYNFSDKEDYTIDNDRELEGEQFSSRIGRKYSTKRLAFNIGADWKKCIKNENLVPDSILLHEFGHAYDFIENYLKPQYELCSEKCRGPEALWRSTNMKSINRRDYSLRSPDGIYGILGRSSPEWKKSEYRLKVMGINNYDEYLYARSQYYRDMPDEAFADQFAYDFIVKHFDDYFTTDKDERSERIFVDRTKEIDLDPDFVHVLGIKQGLGVEIDRLDDKRQSTKHITGFLAMNMYVGKSVYLYENGDPKNPGEKWRICSDISEMTLKPIRNSETGKISRHVFFKDENGVEYHISRTKEEPVAVTCSVAEMMDDLGLEVGSKLQIVKHLGEDIRMDMGKLALSSWTRQVMEKEITFVDSSTNTIEISEDGEKKKGTLKFGGDYLLKRKWNRYFIETTDNMNFEVIPLSERNN